MSGGVMGLGDSLINNENPITTMLRYAVINSVIGAGAGGIGYKLTQDAIQRTMLKNRRLKIGTKDKGTTIKLYDKIDKNNQIDEFDYNKVKRLSEDLKKGKRNPNKFQGKVVKKDNITPKEREYVYGKIDSDLSDYEKQLGYTTRRLYNEELKRDYLYFIKYDKNGQHIIRRYYINDDIY